MAVIFRNLNAPNIRLDRIEEVNDIATCICYSRGEVAFRAHL